MSLDAKLPSLKDKLRDLQAQEVPTDVPVVEAKDEEVEDVKKEIKVEDVKKEIKKVKK